MDAIADNAKARVGRIVEDDYKHEITVQTDG